MNEWMNERIYFATYLHLKLICYEHFEYQNFLECSLSSYSVHLLNKINIIKHGVGCQWSQCLKKNIALSPNFSVFGVYRTLLFWFRFILYIECVHCCWNIVYKFFLCGLNEYNITYFNNIDHVCLELIVWRVR